MGKKLNFGKLGAYYILGTIGTWILIIAIIAFIIYYHSYRKNQRQTGPNYMQPEAYSEFIIQKAEEHADPSQLTFDTNYSNQNYDNQKVYFKYTFVSDLTDDEYEEIAYNEMKYVYETIKDITLNKKYLYDNPKKDLYFVFYKIEDEKEKKVGGVTIYYSLGDYLADSYINKEKYIIYSNQEKQREEEVKNKLLN